MGDPTSATNMRAAQFRVRQEAEEMHDVLADLRRWEENVKTKDDALKTVASRRPKPQYGTEAVAPAVGPDASSDASEVVSTGSSLSTAAAEATTEREKGNAHFKRGEFQQAVKSYTRSIALFPKDVLGYSNRSMAYLRLKVLCCETPVLCWLVR
jgi:tetratricopeptide (TPR) repeat protein